jgi:hypothetical protein
MGRWKVALVAALLGAGAGAGAMSSAANATPFTLHYTVAPGGLGWNYSFSLILDNHDSSWVAGQEFDWFVIGDLTTLNVGVFPDGPPFFTSLPPILTGSYTGGSHNGATLCYGDGACLFPGYVPTLNSSLDFTGSATTLETNILWSINVPSSGAAATLFETAVLDNSPVPLPAALPLFATVLGGAGFVAWRRKAKARRNNAAAVSA